MLSLRALLVVLSLAVLAFAQSANAQMSFCDKYSMALFNSTDGATETKLVTAIVTRAVLGDTSVRPPVEGLVGPRSPILRVRHTAHYHQQRRVSQLLSFTSLAALSPTTL